MKILGIDPGIAKVGISIINSDSLRVEHSECFVTNKKFKHGERLWQISQKISEVINQFSPDISVIEKLFFNQSVTNALRVSESRGVILLELTKKEIDVFEYTPLQVKLRLTGYGRATKKDIILKIFDILSVDVFLKNDDEADSLALALCYIFDLNENKNLLKKIRQIVKVELLQKPAEQKKARVPRNIDSLNQLIL